MSTTQTGIEIVESFFEAATSADPARAFAYFTDDIEYQNVPLPPDRGRKAVERTLRLFLRVAPEFRVTMHNIAERDGVVLTERTDVVSAARPPSLAPSPHPSRFAHDDESRRACAACVGLAAEWAYCGRVFGEGWGSDVVFAVLGLRARSRESPKNSAVGAC